MAATSTMNRILEAEMVSGEVEPQAAEPEVSKKHPAEGLEDELPAAMEDIDTMEPDLSSSESDEAAEALPLADETHMGTAANALPSVGSLLHASGDCKRCCFFHKGRCANGHNCQFCHLPHERRTRGRGCRGHGTSKKDAAAAAAAAVIVVAALPAPALPPPPLAPPPGLTPPMTNPTGCRRPPPGLDLPPSPMHAACGPSSVPARLARAGDLLAGGLRSVPEAPLTTTAASRGGLPRFTAPPPGCFFRTRAPTLDLFSVSPSPAASVPRTPAPLELPPWQPPRESLPPPPDSSPSDFENASRLRAFLPMAAPRDLQAVSVCVPRHSPSSASGVLATPAPEQAMAVGDRGAQLPLWPPSITSPAASMPLLGTQPPQRRAPPTPIATAGGPPAFKGLPRLLGSRSAAADFGQATKASDLMSPFAGHSRQLHLKVSQGPGSVPSPVKIAVPQESFTAPSGLADQREPVKMRVPDWGSC